MVRLGHACGHDPRRMLTHGARLRWAMARLGDHGSVYFTYVDETGTDGTSPVTVMAGIVANSERVGRTRAELAQILGNLGEVATGYMTELKSKHLLAGTGAWKNVPGETRRNVVSNLCGWVCDRKHDLALAAIDQQRFEENPFQRHHLRNPWQASAWHIALQMQRAQQSRKGNKGRTVLVFDDNKREAANFSDLVYDPPAWSDDYYCRHPKRQPLDQIVDTPFVVKSHQVGLVQIADIFASLFRRYTELRDYGQPERYAGEHAHVTEWIEMLTPRHLPRSHRWPQRTSSECANWYGSVAPPALLDLR